MRGYLFLLMLPVLLRGEFTWQTQENAPFEISLQWNTQQLSPPDSLHLEATFRYPSSYDLDSESLVERLIWTANALNPLFAIQHQNVMTATVADKQETKVNVVLNPLMMGLLDLSFLTVNFSPKDKTQKTVSIATPVLTVVVQPMQAHEVALPYAPLAPLETQFPLDLTQKNRQTLFKDPRRLANEKQKIQATLKTHTFPWLSAFILLGGGGIGWALYSTRRQWLGRRVKKEMVMNPQAKAQQALQALQEKHLPEQGLFKAYYGELTTILLTALQEHFGWHAISLTKEELAYNLKKQSTLSEEMMRKILKFLVEADQVKFANKESSLQLTQQANEKVQALIQSLFNKSREQNLT